MIQEIMHSAPKYENDKLYFKVNNEQGWVSPELIANPQAIEQFWTDLNKVREEKHKKQMESMDTIQIKYGIPIPQQLIKISTKNAQKDILCRFSKDVFLYPVWVPIEYLQATCPSLLEAFLENEVTPKSS